MSGVANKLLDQMPGGFLCFTEAGLVLTINQTLLDQLGYEPSAVVGRSVESLLTTASQIFYQTHLYPLLKLQGKADEIFLSFRMQNGQSLPVLLSAATVGQGELSTYQCVCLVVRQRQKYDEEMIQAKRVAEQALRENSELAQAKEALEISQQLLDQQLMELEQKNQQLLQFGKLITHDLQEPLRKIMMLADLLGQDVEENQVVSDQKLVSRISQASQTMRELIQRLRKYQLLDSVPLRIEPTDLGQVLLDAKAIVDQQWKAGDSRLIHQGMPLIEGDRSQLVELFVQLMDNSVRFNHHPGHIPVEITVTGQLIEHNSFRSTQGKYRYQEFVRITYSDNGPGLDAGLGDKLFQIHKKASADSLGLGFGLAMSAKIVDNHGGMISANTSGKLKTQFIILLPIRYYSLPKS